MCSKCHFIKGLIDWHSTIVTHFNGNKGLKEDRTTHFEISDTKAFVSWEEGLLEAIRKHELHVWTTIYVGDLENVSSSNECLRIVTLLYTISIAGLSVNWDILKISLAVDSD